jgi:hypothetical protein
VNWHSGQAIPLEAATSISSILPIAYHFGRYQLTQIYSLYSHNSKRGLEIKPLRAGRLSPMEPEGPKNRSLYSQNSIAVVRALVTAGKIVAPEPDEHRIIRAIRVALSKPDKYNFPRIIRRMLRGGPLTLWLYYGGYFAQFADLLPLRQPRVPTRASASDYANSANRLLSLHPERDYRTYRKGRWA